MYARHKRELQIRCIPLTFHSLGRCNFQTPLHTLSLFISTHCQPEIWMLFHGLLRSWKIQKVVVFEYKLWKVMQSDWIWNVLEKWQGKNSIIRSVLLNYFGPIFMVISQESTRKGPEKVHEHSWNFMTSKAYIPNVFCLFLALIYISFASRQHGMIIF